MKYHIFLIFLIKMEKFVKVPEIPRELKYEFLKYSDKYHLDSLTNELRITIESGDAKALQTLIDNTPNIDLAVQNNEAIILASQNGHTDIVELLLQDDRVDPTVI